VASVFAFPSPAVGSAKHPPLSSLGVPLCVCVCVCVSVCVSVCVYTFHWSPTHERACGLNMTDIKRSAGVSKTLKVGGVLLLLKYPVRVEDPRSGTN